MKRALITVVLLVFSSIFTKVNSQVVITSSYGWTATVQLTPTGVIANPGTGCPWSYNYDITYTYSVSFTGATENRSFDGNIYFTCSAGNGSQPYKNIGLTTSDVSGETSTNNQARTVANTSGNAFGYTYPNKKCSEFTIADANCTEAKIDYWGKGVENGTQYLNFGTPLPIILADFSVRKKDDFTNLISWKTNIEINNHYFAIQRSFDGSNWTTVQEVKGRGTSYESTVYEIEDRNYHQATYYRLVQFDLDGKSSTSASVSTGTVQNEKVASLRLYPNPSKSYVIPEASVIYDGYQLLDAVGKTVKSGSLEMNHKIDLEGLQSGIYKLLLTKENVLVGMSSVVYQP